MKNPIINDLEQFMADTGISAHRAGMLLVKNGRLVERLRSGCRVWPETEARIRSALAREKKKRGLPIGAAAK